MSSLWKCEAHDWCDDRIALLEDTLREARDVIVMQKDHLEGLCEREVMWFGPALDFDASAYELWEAMTQDAEERGEGRVAATERLCVQYAWESAPARLPSPEAHDTP